MTRGRLSTTSIILNPQNVTVQIYITCTGIRNPALVWENITGSIIICGLPTPRGVAFYFKKNNQPVTFESQLVIPHPPPLGGVIS